MLTIHDFLASVDNIHRALATELFYAVAFVCKHQGPSKQMRASGEPYLNHLAEVAYNVMHIRPIDNPDELLDDETIIAAILHDIIEDTTVIDHEILQHVFSKSRGQKFGLRVADMVQAASKKRKTEFIGTDEERSEEAFARMINYAFQDWEILTFKTEDRKHNMRTLGGLRENLSNQPDKPSDRQRRIATQTIERFVPFLETEALQIVPVRYHHWLLSSAKELKGESARYLPDDYEIVIRKI